MEQVREGLRLFRALSDVHGAAEALINLSIHTEHAGDPEAPRTSPAKRSNSPARPATSG